MSKTKQLSSASREFAKGGGKGMFGKDSAGPQKPGVTEKSGKGGGKFAAGGAGKMFGKQAASPRPAGKTGK